MEWLKLNDVCDVRDGTHDSPKYVTEGYPLVTSKNIINGEIDITNVNFISEEDFIKINKRSKVDNGDILMPMIGTIGKPVVVKKKFEFAIKNVALIKFYIDSKVLPQYIYYVLESSIFKRYVEKENRGGTQKFLSLSNIRNFMFPVPSLEVQNKIIQALNKAKLLINKRQSQITALDELKQSLFLEIFGDLRLNPFNWEYKKLEQLYEIIDGDRGKNYPKQHDFFEDEYCLFLNTGNVTSKGFNFSKTAFITKEKDESLRKGKMKKDDIVVTTRGTVGNIAYFDEHVPYEQIRINSGMVILRSKVEINPIFFMNYFRNPVVYKNLISGTAQPQMPINNMKNALLYYPPIEIQNSYAEKIERINHKSRLLEKALVEYEILYESILNKAFKGELFQD